MFKENKFLENISGWPLATDTYCVWQENWNCCKTKYWKQQKCWSKMSNWQELNAGWFSCEVQEIIENLQHAMFNSHPCGNSQLQNLINAGKWGKTCDQQMELSRTHQHLLNLSNSQLSHPNATFSIYLLLLSRKVK